MLRLFRNSLEDLTVVGYPGLLFVSFLGKTIKMLLVAMACFYGVKLLSWVE